MVSINGLMRKPGPHGLAEPTAPALPRKAVPMIEGIRPVVFRAIGALHAFGVTGRSPLHIRRVLAMWPDVYELSVDESDRVVLACIVRCRVCHWPVERVADPTGDFWRHVDIPEEPHAAEVSSVRPEKRVDGPCRTSDELGEGAAV
jgi:hypothetical protein